VLKIGYKIEREEGTTLGSQLGATTYDKGMLSSDLSDTSRLIDHTSSEYSYLKTMILTNVCK
jgi:hypothetical protein